MATRPTFSTQVATMSEADEAGTDSPSERIIVGVDIGYTCTGVAICSTDQKPGEPIKPIPVQKWPGSDTTGSKISNKVPTVLTYRAGDLRVRSWGFACPSRRELGPRRNTGLFKFLLDEEYLEKLNREKPDDDPEHIENVRKFFTDFLSKLHEHVVAQLEDSPWRVDWRTTKVEYIFSLPTSWEKNDELVEEFGKIIEKAGFGSEENSIVSIGLTEGVASAVYTAKSLNHNFKEGDVLLVCDAGGGTTDICVLKVAAIDKMTVELETLAQTPIFVGSVQIDEEFEDLFNEKLVVLKNRQPDLFKEFVVEEYTGEDVARGEFQPIKHNWGTGLAPPEWRFSVKGLLDNERADHHGAKIDGALPDVTFLHGEIEGMFDNQIKKIKVGIDTMLDKLQKLRPELNVSSLVLCGGLGSSPYVQSQMADHYTPRGMEMLIDTEPSEPPLSVCKGLVLDRMQRLLYGTSVLRTRRCRASYGILRPEAYNKSGHKGHEPYLNPADNRKYVNGHIEWFIWKGDIIAEDEKLRMELTRIASFENPDTTWVDTIVTSKLPPDCLPRYLGEGDSRVACKIASDSQRVPDSLTSKRNYMAFGKKFLQGSYEIWGFLEQENIRFETMVNGVKVGAAQTLQVPWEYIRDDESTQ